MPVVVGTVVVPGRVPARYAKVVIDLVASVDDPHAPGYDLTANETIISRITLAVDDDGAWSQDLVANADLTPENTVYKVTYTISGRSPASPFYITVPDTVGPHEVTDLLTDPPGALTPSGLAAEIVARAAADSTLAAQIGTKVPLAGGTMTGPLVLPGDATLPLHATPLQQVQALVAQAVADLLDGAPGALDTLNELAAALGDDASFSAAVTTALAGKASTADLTTEATTRAANDGTVLRATGVAATDTAAIQAAIATGAVVRLRGAFVTNAALLIDGVTDVTLWAIPGDASITNTTNTALLTVQNASRVTLEGLKLVGSDDVAKTSNTGIAIVHTNSDIRVAWCEIADMGYDGIYALRSTDGLVIDHCYVHGCNDDGINPGGGGGAGITENVTVTNNVVRDCTNDGIHVSIVAENMTFTGNVVEGCNAGFGFYDSSQAMIVGNTIRGCNYGFRTESGHGSTDVTILGNIVDTCGRGVNVVTGHTRWKILGNTFIDCTDYGVVFSYASGAAVDADSTVGDNTFVGGCATAAFLASACTNVAVHDNGFTNITGHAISTGSGVGTFNAVITVHDNRFKSVTGTKRNVGTGSTIVTQDWRRKAKMPTGVIAETVDRTTTISADSASLVSGRLTLVSIDLEAGDVISGATFVSGVTPLAAGTAQWAELRDASRNKLAVSNDKGATAWAASAEQAFTFGTPYTVPISGMYYVAICVVATTVPTLRAASISSPISTKVPILQGASTSGLTGPGDSPTTAAALTVQGNRPYAYVT